MNYYSSMDGLNHILQCRWNVALSTTHVSGVKEREFPNGKGCILDLYYKFEEEMNRKWHPNVNLGAAVSGDQLLTDHGVEHVKSVIAHAKDILSDIERLNGYEIYLLLVCYIVVFLLLCDTLYLCIFQLILHRCFLNMH